MIKTSFEPYEGDEDFLFVSYAREDIDEIIPILERLNEEGYRIWYDEGIPAGYVWLEYIEEHLQKSAVVISFLSPNVNESYYFRSELTVAIDEKKPVLGVILHKTALKKGLKMLFSSLQWIEKYRYEEKQFYKKLLASPILNSCRKSNEFVPPVASEANNQPEKAISSGANDLKEISISFKNKTTRNKLTGFSKHYAKGKFRQFLPLLLILTTLVIASAIYIRYSKTKAESAQVEAENSFGGEVKGGHKVIPSEVFWGNLTCIESFDNDLNDFSSTYQISNGIELELVSLPLSMTVYADDPNHMIVTFQDKYGVTFDFISDYSVENGVLTLSEPSNYIDEENSPSSLTGKLQYDLSIGLNKITLTYNYESRKYRNIGRGEESLTLQGTACSKNDIYNGIVSVNIDTEDKAKGTSCQLFFEDGGYSTDATINTVTDASAGINMSEEIIPYNGRWQENHREAKYFIHYINTYPYGFVIKDNNGDYYRYQNPVMELGELTESEVK